MGHQSHQLSTMTPRDETFFKRFGKKLAALRTEYGYTQVQLAEIIGISQVYLVNIEKGRRRMPMSCLPILADLFSVSVDELIGRTAIKKSRKRGPSPKLQRQLELLQQLPRAKQRWVSELLDGVLRQAG